jgi:hypothetical protein
MTTSKSEDQDLIEESNDKIAEKKSDKQEGKPVKKKQASIFTIFAKSNSKEALVNNKIIPGENSPHEDHMGDDVDFE